MAPWADDDDVEQDLVITLALFDIFRDDALQASLAFRGGTALHKLHLPPAARYSEDIDLVQREPGPIISALRTENRGAIYDRSFYSDELGRASWTVDAIDSVGIPTTVETSVDVWRKGDVLFRLSMLRKDDPRVPAAQRPGEFDTFYQVTLIAKPLADR